MAIGAESGIEFHGAVTELQESGGSVAVADLAFSAGTTDIDQWTNTDDAPWAAMTLQIDWNTNPPDVGTFVNLYGRAMNYTDIPGTTDTNDADVPDANFPHIFLGSFPVNDVVTEQFITIDIRLPNWESQTVWEFYIENRTGETCEAAWGLHIRPKALGPHA